MPNNRGAGSLLILVFLLMVSMSLFVGGLMFIAGREARDTGFTANDYRLLHLADAGVDRAMRQLRTDYLTLTQTGTADLRGGDTSSCVSVSSQTRLSYIDGSYATINNNSDQAIIGTFDSNYTQTRIISVVYFVSASRSTGGSGATIQASYTTNGSAYTTVMTQALPNSTTFVNYSADITGSLTWAQIMSPNFRLRVVRTAGNRNVNLDAMWLQVTYGIDTNTESWYTGSYAGYPITLGEGAIQSVSIGDEQGKVHLNTASRDLLRYLMIEHGVNSSTALTLANNIISYRTTKDFDSVEELKSVTSMTDAVYDAIEPDITVYSYINEYAQGPAGSRAPVNINTASREVLLAIFDPLSIAVADKIRLADDIIAQRASNPFTDFYDSFSSGTNFYDFERARSYLNNTEDDRVLGNADASLLVPRSGGTNRDALTTEFCYASAAFEVQSVGRAKGVDFRVTTKIKNSPGDTGNLRTFYNYTGDTTAAGHRRESYE